MLIDFFKKIWKHLLITIVGIFIGLMINVPSCNKVEPIIKYIEVKDTIEVPVERIVENTVVKYVDRVDTCYITEKGDTVYIKDVPIEHKQYKDVIATDSTSTKIDIEYHGFAADIDNINLVHTYYNKLEIIPEEKKRISPFIGVTMGPVINTNFTQAKGVATELGGGIIFNKSGWGIQANYEMDILPSEVQHSIKAGVIKQF